MEEKRIGDWIQTYSGRPFWPLDPRPNDIVIEDIAHSLSMQARFAGHGSEFYSVAQHCVLIHDELSVHKFAGLMHDASEAYLVDVPRPIKPMLSEYKRIEIRLEEVIFAKYGIPFPFPDIVKEYDTRILLNEKEWFMKPGLDWNFNGLEPLFHKNQKMTGWTQERAKQEFINRFVRYI